MVIIRNFGKYINSLLPYYSYVSIGIGDRIKGVENELKNQKPQVQKCIVDKFIFLRINKNTWECVKKVEDPNRF